MDINSIAVFGYCWFDNELDFWKFNNNEVNQRIIHLLEKDNEYLDVQYSLYEDIKKFIFKWKEIEKEDLKFLNKAIDFIFLKYKWKLRNNWETVITHLVRSSLFTIRNFKNPSIKKTITTLLHDIIEDWYSTFEEIKKYFWKEIALMVLALSKDRDLLKREEYSEKINFDDSNFKKNKKKIIDEEYFERYQSLEKMISYLKKFVKENNINIDWLNIEEMVFIIFDVKLADRCHNLCTQWDPHWIKKIFKKINETFYYLVPIAEKHNREALRIILLLIWELYNLDVMVNWEVVWKLSYINWEIVWEKLKIDFWKRNIIKRYNNYHWSLKRNMLKTTL